MEADPIWRECFALAWESFRAGSVAVGAVLVDPDGRVVARGRNRLAETDAPAGQVAGSYLAHAELNALATLPPGDHPGHVLYTTLEPCLLCTAALRYSHIGTVRYAAEDPTCAGIDRIPTLGPQMAHRFATREGPLTGPLRRLGLVLHILSGISRGAQPLLDAHRAGHAAELEQARTLDLDELRGLDLDQAAALISGGRSGR